MSGAQPTPSSADLQKKNVEKAKSKLPIRKIRDSDAGGLPNVKREEYFHGFMPKDQTEKLLQRPGEFLLRQAVKAEAQRKSVEQFIISVRISGAAADGKKSKDTVSTTEEKPKNSDDFRHINVMHSRRARLYYVKNFGFTHVSGLIEYHRRHKLPLDDSGTIIKSAIRRAEWQLNHEQFQQTKKLGDGAFGDVFLGSLCIGLISTIEVAVKTINGTITSDENEKLFQEAMLMKNLKHPNIVQLIGVASNEEPVMIVMEFAPGGSVLDAVKKQPGASFVDRCFFCLGAAKGLQYIHSEGIIHRDIAARNVLIGKNKEAKISDFGLSVIGTSKKERVLKKVPIRYLSPETLGHGIYNEGSDVWSFGVYIWETFNDGAEPFGEIELTREVRKKVIGGMKLEKKTELYPPRFWAITEKCFWEKTKRPNFKLLVEDLQSAYDEFRRTNGDEKTSIVKRLFSRMF